LEAQEAILPAVIRRHLELQPLTEPVDKGHGAGETACLPFLCPGGTVVPVFHKTGQGG